MHDNVPPYPIGRYWDAASNPDGAPFDEKLELLKAGPWCYKDEAGTETVECPSKADRTQRSGIWENKRWRREDRFYCSNNFFRSRVVPDEPGVLSEENCREVLTERNKTCHMECGKCALPQQRIRVDLAADLPPPGCTDICDSYCSNSAARNTKNLYGCSVGLPVMGFFAATQVSDAGLDIVGRHGANRPAGRPPTPDSSFVEEYAILIQNSVEQPRAPRNSISCRKDHREQT